MSGTFFELSAGAVHPEMRATPAEWLESDPTDVLMVSDCVQEGQRRRQRGWLRFRVFGFADKPNPLNDRSSI
jgi:hypothetical protein